MKITVGYWAIRGLAAPLRMMLMYKAVPFQCTLYECRENADGSFNRDVWLQDAKPALRERNALMNLPYIIDEEEDVVVAQSNACFLYLGRKLDMLGDNSKELSLCEQLLCEVMDLRNQLVGYAYSPRGASQEETAKWLIGIRGILDKLNAVLSAAPNSALPFFVGARASAPDFHIWEILDQINSIASFHSQSNPVADFPALQSFHTTFASLPENKRYISSPLHSLPMNNPSAKVGATPAGGPWVSGSTVFAWEGRSGMY
jgi:glutathione S-transferase